MNVRWMDSGAGLSVELTLAVVVVALFIVPGSIFLKNEAGIFVRSEGRR